MAVFYAADGGFAGWEAGTVAAGTGGNYHAGGAGTLGFFDVSEGDGKWKLLVPQNFEYAGGLTLGLRSIALGSSTAAGARLTFGSETDLTVLGQFAVAHGSTVDFGGGTVASVGTLTVAGTSTIICRGLNTGEQVGSVWAGEGVTIAAGTLSVEAGSTITADGQGYAGGAGGGNNGLGPGGGIYTGGPWRQGGGGHGGAGGHAANGGTGGAACGSAFEPADLGSGGSSDDSSNEAGGPGGGAIRLDVSGTFSLDGTVTANGERPGNDIGAGGAGGSIWVTCGTLAGSGCFQADGAGRHYNEGAGGAGGRVAVYYATDGGFGGFAASTAAAGASCYAAERGSVIFLDTSIPDWHLWIYRDLVLGADTEMTLGAVTVTNAGRLVIGGGSTISVRGAFVVTGSSTVVCRGTNTSAQVDGQWAGQGVRINAGSMTVAAGSTITADGQGYAGGAGGGNNGAGPGGGIYTGGPWTCAGGGYGGAGGHAANGGTGGATYGSAFQPTYLGSGGSSDDSGNEAGGPGGGAIRLVIRDTFTLDGTVTANGARPANDIGAGGAGGSIWVTTNVLTGGGYFRADGASRGPHTEGAGGGGGRIAVDYADAASFGGQASSTAAAGASRYAAEAGTVNFLLRSGEADLVVVEYPTAVPDHAGAGDAVDVGWEVRNQWPGAATAAWTDGVYLSLDDKLDGSDILLATAAATPLNGSESYTRALSVTIPDVPAGEYFLLFAADIWDEQTETVEDNNAAAIAFTVLSGSLPDIEVVQVGAPGLAFWGGRIDVWWRAVNHGPAIAAASWFDGVYLSADELLDASDVQIASARSLEFLPLDAGEEYRQDLPDVEVPIDQAAGMHYLLFVADPYGTLAEADETNNVCAVAIDLPGADLTVAQAAAPASASPGETIAVSWMVANAGDGDALGDWLDRVYLSDDDALDAGDVLLATRDQAARSPLTGTTGQYGDSADVTVPLDAGAGKHWLLLVTDAAATQPETLEDNNVLAVELDVLMPDLRIVATAPAQASWGQTISVSWTVTNDGPGRAMADWTDRVWLCAAAAKDGSEVQIRAVAVTSQTPLDDAGSYTIDADITLPAPSLDGQVYLLFTADDGNAQPEGDEGNNLAAVEIALRGPDLAFSGGSAVPDVLAMGDVVALQWTVANVGLGAAMGSWQDRAYLSRDQAVSADDWRLGALAAGTTPLPAVDDYTSGIEVTIPNLAVGTWYFLVAADSAGALSETGELNNLLAVPVTVVDRLGPYVASWSPAGPLNTDVASLRVVFSEAVLPGSFTAADVTVDGPGGTVDGADITVTPVDDVTFDIAFPARTADGTYSVTIGPDVTDLAGNPLSRAAYATDFEAGAGAEWSDATTSDGGAALSRFLGDFANLTDTLALADLPAHSGVTMLWDLFIIDSWDGNTGGVGPDWWGLNVSGRPAPEVERTFSIFDRNNQTYGGNPDQTGNFYRGGWSEDLYRDVGLVFPHSGGELSLGFYGRNLQGVGDESWGIDNLRVLLTDPVGVANVATFVIERTGPSVTDCQPGDPAVAPLDHFDVTFSEPINAATFGADDVTLTGPAGDIPVNQPVLVSGNTYRVSFAAQMTGGTYTLTVGPAVEDLAGNEMNQDGDAVNGEDPADAFGASVLLTAANLAMAPGVAPAEASWGETIHVTWTVTNTGDGPALADWVDRVYLSADQFVGAGDRLLWTADQAEHSPLAGSGGSYEASADVTMPADLATGAWYLLLVADAGGTQVETDETDNLAAVEVALRGPDLSVFSADLPGAVGWTRQATFTWTVQNAGAGLAAFDWLDKVYLSADEEPGAGDAVLVSEGIAAQTPLAAGGTYTISRTVTIPATAALGSAFMILSLDAAGQQAETDETNNLLVLPVVVTAPDLRVTGLTFLPADIQDGETVTFTATVANGGTDALADFVVRFEIDGQPIARQTVVGGLAGGASTDVTQTWTARPGTHTVRAIADEHGAVPESDETNNAAEAAMPAIVDTTPPVISGMTPADQSKVRGVVQVQVTATDNAAVTSYTFERSADGASWTLLAAGPAATLAWDTTSLGDGAQLVRVTAADAAGNTARRTRTYVVDNTPPGAVTLTATPQEFAVLLSWTPTPAVDLAYYRLYRAAAAGGPYAAINGAMTATSFTDRNTSAGVTCYYVVKAFDHVGNAGAASNMVFAAPLADSTPPTIASLSPAAGSRAAATFALSVAATDNVAVTGYAFAFSPDGQGWTPIASGASASAAWNVAALPSGAYQVRATVSDAAGNSTSLTRQYVVDHDAPAAPAGMRVTADQVALIAAWDPVVAGDFHHYELSRSADGGAWTVVVAATTSTVHVDRQVDTGHTYAYRVVAADDLGNAGAPSEEASGEPLADTNPPVVRSLTPADGTRVRDVVALTATAEDLVRVTALVFEFCPVGQTSWTLIARDEALTQTGANRWQGAAAWDTAALADGEYTIRVTAVDYGDNTHEVSHVLILDRAPPPAPEGLSITDPRSGGRLQVGWSPVSEAGLAAYRVYRSETAGGGYELAATTTQTAWTDAGLTNGAAYYYVVTAVDQAGNESPASAEAGGTPTAETDLSVEEITFDPAVPVLGRSGLVRAKVRNAGPAGATVTISFFDGAELIGTQALSLSAAATAAASIAWAPGAPGAHEVSAVLSEPSATDVNGANDSLAAQVAVNIAPTADAGADREADWNSPIAFGPGGSSDDDGQIVSARWDFGDGETSDRTAPTHAWMLPGTYTVTLTVTDNRGAAGQDTCTVTVRDTRADLTVAALGWTPLEPVEGDDVAITATIANTGSGPTLLGFFAAYYIDGLYRGYQRVNTLLAIGQSVDVTFHWTAPKGLHTVRVVADDIQNNIAETDETNNAAEANLTLQQVFFPDLTVAALACDVPDPAGLSSEQPLVARATVSNGGTADAFDFWVSLYVDGALAGRQHVGELVVGEQTQVSLQFTPADGAHTLTAVADDPVSAVLESDETNNAASLALPALSLAYPDLVAAGLVVRPTETVLSDGTSFDLSATVRNAGSVAVEHRFTLSYYLDGQFVGSRQVTYLPAGAAQTLAVQTLATGGTHVAAVVIDEDNAIREGDETNNAASADIPEITILYPDLVVSNVTWAPLDPVYGQTVNFLVTVSNQTVVSTLSTCIFKLYVDGQEVKRQELPRIRGNSSVQFALQWPAKVSPNADHTITAVVDSEDAVHEEDETNNTWGTAGGVRLQVADTLILDVSTPGGMEDMWDQLFFSSRQTAQFVAKVSLGSAPEDLLGWPEVEAHIVITWYGHFDEDEFGQPVWVDDQVVRDEAMTYDSAGGTFRTDLPLLSYGTGEYGVRVEATDGVYTAASMLNMLVIEEINFELTTDKAVYQRGEVVMISGRATRLSGQPVAGEKVAIVVTKGLGDLSGYAAIWGLVDGTARMMQVTTDGDGRFAYAFHPLWGDAGQFSADAYVVSDVFGTVGHAAFQILAMDLDPARLHVTTSKNSTYTRTLTLKNLSDVPLTGLQVTLTDTDAGDNVTATLSWSQATSLAPGASIPLTLTVSIPETAPDGARFDIHAGSDEGPVADGYVRFTLVPAHPVPDLSPGQVSVALNPGGYLTRTLTLTNDGMGTMSGITLIDPPILPWVSLGGLGSTTLTPGQSTTFEVLVAPGQDVKPGIYADRIVATDGTYRADMVLTVEVTTANRGSMSFVIVNDAGQKVKDAEITLVSQEEFRAVYGDGSVSTYHNIYRARTGADGVANILDIPVGGYEYAICAPGHESLRGTVEVMPASEARIIDVTMTAVLLSYKWTVTPIVIEDTYDITLNLTFVANVPKPTFAFLPPWVALPQTIEDAFGDQVIVINPSLIELHDVTARVVGVEGIQLTAGGAIGDMAAQTSVVLGYMVAPGDYSGLNGSSTYIELRATYVTFDPVTLLPMEEEAELVGKIPLVNPSSYTVKVTYEEGGTGKEIQIPMPEEGDGEAEEFKKMGGGGPLGGLGGTVAEVVKLEIQQKATLEREGFDARLELTSGMDAPMVGLSISPRVMDASGVDVTDRFYIVPPELTGIAAIDGSANLPAYGKLTGRWILIPGDGLGGTDLGGQKYYVKAVFSYYLDGQLKETQTNAVEITVHPQPKLYFHYYVPRKVFADIPFKLGLLVENDGDGIAWNLKIDSGQPEIVENEAGLLIDFRIVGSSFGSVTGDIVRLVLGDVAPHSTAHGYWIMQSTLDGTFVEFTAELTHRDYKGIQINPLILSVDTEIIERDNLFADAQDPNNAFSLIDRDEDGFPDYLINLWSGLRLPIIIPDNVAVTRPVSEQDRTMDLTVPPTAGYVCIVLPDPAPEWNYRAVVRHNAEGPDTYLSGNNFWRDHGNIYFVDELGYVDPDSGLKVPTGATYTLDFRSALDIEQLNVAPKEFSILYPGDEIPDLGDGAADLYVFHQPQPGSALGTYELVNPIFYIPTPPTEGQKAAIRAVITNNGVLAESGTVEFRATAPDGGTTLLGAVEIDELKPWRHLNALIEWTPPAPGQYTITAGIPGDSPAGQASVTVTVNAMPYADAGADFFSDVMAKTTFDGTRSLDDDGYCRLYFWDFDDGAQWSGGMTPTHVYRNSGTYRVHVYVKDNNGAICEDVMQVTIRENRPDLVVESISVSPADPQEGQTVTITAAVANVGYGATPAGGFYVGLYVDGAYQGLQRVGQSLAVGQSVDVSLTWTASLGNHMFTFVADDMTNEVTEANEDNNERTAALFPDQVYFPDLVCQDVTLSVTPEDPTPWGEAITLTAHVRNVGTAAAGAFRVSFYVDAQFVGYGTIASLGFEAGDDAGTASCQWVPTEGAHRVYVFVDYPIGHVVELDERNNTYAEDIPALNIIYGDLVVESVDLWPGSGRIQYPDPLVIGAMVANHSSTPVVEPFEVQFYVGGVLLGSETVGGLAAGAVQRVRVSVPAPDGTQDIAVIADVADEVPEADEYNNACVLSQVTFTTALPDLVVDRISFTPAEATYGEATAMAIRYANLGLGRTYAPFTLRLYVNDELVDATRQTLSMLPGGAAYWFPKWTSEVFLDGQADVRAEVDTLDELVESNEDNNTTAATLTVHSGYVLQTKEIALTMDVTRDFAGPGGLDPDTHLSGDTPVYQLRLSQSTDPETFLGPAGGASAVASVVDGAGAVRSTAAMDWDADRRAFVAPMDLTGLAEGRYTVRFEVAIGGKTLLSERAIEVASDFAMTLESDQDTYSLGGTVQFSGTVVRTDASAIADLPVTVTVLDSRAGLTRTLQAVTDAAGQFACSFAPAMTEGGFYSAVVSAERGGVTRLAYATFSINGMAASMGDGGGAARDLWADDSHQYQVEFVNLGAAPVAALIFSAASTAPDTVVPQLDLTGTATSLGPGESTTVTVTVNTSRDAPSEAQVTVEAVGDTAEMAQTIDCNVRDPAAQYAFNQDSIEVNVAPGQTDLDPARLQIINVGRDDMTDLAIEAIGAPPWFSIRLWPEKPGTLDSGESQYCFLNFRPDQVVRPGTYEFDVKVTSSAGERLIHVKVVVAPAESRTLIVKVYNNLIDWKLNRRAPIPGATVYLKRFPKDTTPCSAEETVAKPDYTGVTDVDGQCTLEKMLVGQYKLVVVAPSTSYSRYEGQVELVPGQEPDTRGVMMQLHPFDISWDASTSQERQSLGETDLTIKMRPVEDKPVLLPDKPAGEYYLQIGQGDNYALIYAGSLLSGWELSEAKQLYATLTTTWKIPPANIHVLVSTTGATNADFPGANLYTANASDMQKAVAELAQDVTAEDAFLMYVGDHGSLESDGPYAGHAYVTSGLSSAEGKIYDTQLASWISAIHGEYETYVFTQCKGGGFVDALRSAIPADESCNEFACSAGILWESTSFEWGNRVCQALANGMGNTYELFQYATANSGHTTQYEWQSGGTGTTYEHPQEIGGNFQIFHCPPGANSVNRRTDKISINNPSDQPITGVRVEAVGIHGDALYFSNLKGWTELGTIDPHGSVSFTYRIFPDAFKDITEDTIFDGGYLHVTGVIGQLDGQDVTVTTDIPIRIRVGENIDYCQGQKYEYVEFAQSGAAEPVMYGTSFVATWDKDAQVVTPTLIAGSTASTEVSIQGQAVTVSATVTNVLPDKTVENVTGTVLLSRGTLSLRGWSFQGSVSDAPVDALTPLAVQIAPGETATGSWKAWPTGSGSYYVYVLVNFEIDGAGGFVLIDTKNPKEIKVDPLPQLSVHYTTDRLGQTLTPDQTFRINVTVSNAANELDSEGNAIESVGTARDVQVGLPAISGTSGSVALTVVGSSAGAAADTLSLGDVAPGQTATGWWDVQASREMQLSNVTSSVVRTRGLVVTDQVAGAGGLKTQSTGGYTKDDLLAAMEELKEAALNKIDGDRQRTTWFVAEAAKIMRELDPLNRAWTDLAAWQNQIALSGALLGLLDPNVTNVSQLGDAAAGLHDYTIPYVANPGSVRELWEIIRDSLDAYDRASWSATWLGIPAKMDYEQALSWINSYLDLYVPYYLPKDYVFVQYADEFAGLTDQQVLERLIDIAKADFPVVCGLATMKAAVEKNLDGAMAFVSTLGDLPAQFPIDPLMDEIGQLIDALNRTSQGWGIPEVDRTTGETVRQPAAWYSVGERMYVTDPETGQPVATWMPMHLQPWEFGATFEPCYALSKVFEHQYWQFSAEWELLSTTSTIQAWSAGLNGSSSYNPILDSGPAAMGLQAGGWDAAAACWSLEDTLAVLKTHENIGFQWMFDRLYQLFDTQVYEDMGVWRMSWDVLNHMEYLYEQPPADPPVPVFVESIYTPDVVLAGGELAAARTGYAVVRNDADHTVQVNPTIHIYSESVDLGSYTAESVTIAPGETADFRLPYGGPSSVLAGIEGYDVEVFLDVYDPATMSSRTCGPYHGHYYVGTADELGVLDQQSVRVVHAGDINTGDRLEAVVAADPSVAPVRMRFLLSQSETANLDLHVYDSAGRHVGINYDTGQADLEIPGAEYHGTDGIAEWIWVDVPPGETYRVVVQAVSAPVDTQFAVTALEVPEYPALLYLPIPDVQTSTNERTVDLRFAATEYGKQRDVVDLGAVAGDLTDGLGDAIPAAAISFDFPATTVPAGQTVGWSATIEIPAELPDGTYRGTFTLTGTDAVSGAAVSRVANVTIVLDTTAPPAPVLEEIDSPVTDGAAPVRGAAEAGTVVELLLDGEHLTYVLPMSDGHLAYGVPVPAGSHVLTARAGDGSGNWSDQSPPITVASTVDLTAPVTTPTVSGTAGEGDWYVSAVGVELAAADEEGGSGVAATRYSLNGGIEWNDYDGTPVALAGEGERTVWFCSTDAAGNGEDVQVLSVEIDTTAPTSSVDAMPATSDAGFEVSWSGQDAAGGSGLASFDVWVSVDAGPWAVWLSATTDTQATFVGQAAHRYAFYSVARDAAGNVEPAPAGADAETVVPGAPVVASVQIDDGLSQRSTVRSITVVFDQPVTLAAGAISVVRSDDLHVAVAAANPSGDGRTYVATFSGTGTTCGSLDDGRYELRVAAGGVTGAAAPMAGDYVQAFHRYYGDGDGDGDVDRGDYKAFRLSYNRRLGSPSYADWFDYDADGRVNARDLAQFRQRYRGTVDQVTHVAPGQIDVQVNAGEAQRSIVDSILIAFDRPVTVEDGTFELARDGGLTVTLTAAPAGDGRSVLLTFSGPEVIGGSLPDGVWTLTTHRGMIRDGAGDAIGTGDLTTRFWRLFGDVDGDGDCDRLDYGSIRGALGSSAGDDNYCRLYDYDGDGDVDGDDLAALRLRVGQRLAP